MSVLSILNRVETKYLIPIIFVIGLLFKCSTSNSPVSQSRNEADINVEKLPFCDENLIKNRQHSKR